MTTKQFVVAEIYELLAMQRVFRAAKFCAESDDTDIAVSPIVARLFTNLMETLISVEVEREGESARQGWIKWLTIDDSRDEWGAAVWRAKKEAEWSNWTEEKKRDYVKVLLSPFILSLGTIEHFLEEVERN